MLGGEIVVLALVMILGLGWIVGNATVPHRPRPHVVAPEVAEREEAPAAPAAPASRAPEPAAGFAGLIGGRPARDRPQPPQRNGQCFIDPATGQQVCPGVPAGGLFRRR
jgi:hypothetical protein